MLRKILKACRNREMSLAELEAFAAEQPEFAAAKQPAYFLAEWLVGSGAMVRTSYDTEGSAIPAESLEGLSVEELDELVEDVSYRTASAGIDALDADGVRSRLESLLEENAAYLGDGGVLLEFLSAPRTFMELDGFLRRTAQGHGELCDGRFRPNVLVDRLEAAGGIVWNGGWTLTDEGRELLGQRALRSTED